MSPPPPTPWPTFIVDVLSTFAAGLFGDALRHCLKHPSYAPPSPPKKKIHPITILLRLLGGLNAVFPKQGDLPF